jgi:CheY-like chemotaxis protein
MQKNNIVVIDDNRSELRLLKEAYRDTGFRYQWKEFTDAHSAFDYLKEKAEDVFIIICDINMPKMTGLELLDNINKNYKLRLRAIPFIFLSASSSEVDIERAYTLSAQGYFQKPMDTNEMTEILKGIIYYWKMAQVPHVIKHEMN